MRPKGSRNTLVKIDYDIIGRLAGISGGTAKAYAQRGEYDSRDLSSLLSWVNSRRSVQWESTARLDGTSSTHPSDAVGHWITSSRAAAASRKKKSGAAASV